MKMTQKRPAATVVVVNMKTLEHTCLLSLPEAIRMLATYATAETHGNRQHRDRTRIISDIYDGCCEEYSHADELIVKYGGRDGFVIASPAWLDREREVRSLKAAVASLEEA